VAFSTDFVHPTGHFVGSNAGGNESAYLFATYAVTEEGPELAETGELHENGRLYACSASRSGAEVVAVVKRVKGYYESSRCTKVHNLARETQMHLRASVHSRHGPVCAAMSPMGDCVAEVHKTDNELMLTVSVRTRGLFFSALQKIDVSQWLCVGNQDRDDDADLIKSSVELAFSPCGRFVAAVDRRPGFNIKAVACGVVIVDTALRQDAKKGLRAFPFFATEDQAPRGFSWTDAGIWLACPGTDRNGSIGSRGGAILIHTPKSLN
jgi:hypothetical protein